MTLWKSLAPRRRRNVRTSSLNILVVCLAVVAGAPASAQKQPSRRPSHPPDVATLKQKAEVGDVKAKFALAGKLLDNARPKDALNLYRELALRGEPEACYRAGEILLFGMIAASPDQQVHARPTEGVRWTYRAATNRHAQAGRNMGRALANGLGVVTNRIEAYAWMQHYTESLRTRDHAELDRMALTLDAGTIREGQKLAKRFQAREWPPLVQPKPTARSLVLKVEGISLGSGNPLAIVNRRSLGIGESTTLQSGKDAIAIRCVEIGADFVCVEVEGEDEPRRLTFGKI